MSKPIDKQEARRINAYLDHITDCHRKIKALKAQNAESLEACEEAFRQLKHSTTFNNIPSVFEAFQTLESAIHKAQSEGGSVVNNPKHTQIDREDLKLLMDEAEEEVILADEHYNECEDDLSDASRDLDQANAKYLKARTLYREAKAYV